MERIRMNTTIYSGVDALDRLVAIKKEKVWLICDQFLVKNGSVDQIVDRLKKENQVTIFSDVVPDPPLEVISKGVVLAKNVAPDRIIGFGGGSAIDTAKGILYFARMIGLLTKCSFLAIPTTSGTGSEVSSATVITDSGVKHPISDETLLPDEVILCPTLTVSVPPAITANTGMDVLTHAVEAYVATNATAYSDAFAEKAIELVFDSLVVCYQDGKNLEARSNMQVASNLAGSAFNLAGLGMNHAIAHQIGAMFHIPHGLANAILLPSIIEKNSLDNKTKARYAKLAKKVQLTEKTTSDYDAVSEFVRKIQLLMDTMQMKQSLKEFGISYEQLKQSIPNMTTNALLDGCRITSPCIYNEHEIEKILLHIY